MSNIIEFSLLSPPFSVNKAYYKNRQLTTEAREWRANILKQLSAPLLRARLAKFRAQFDPLHHSLVVSYTFFLPSGILYNAKGEISSRSMDLTNIEKLLQDAICDNRYNDRIIDNIKISNLDLNDKYITRLQSCKAVSPDNSYMIAICMTIVPLR